MKSVKVTSYRHKKCTLFHEALVYLFIFPCHFDENVNQYVLALTSKYYGKIIQEKERNRKTLNRQTLNRVHTRSLLLFRVIDEI